MSDDIINQAIAESATPISTEVPAPIENSQENIQATEEKLSSETHEPEDVPFPKKAVNALSRRDKQIGKLQAQLAAERAETAKYREQQPKTSTNDAPNEDTFTGNYSEYLKAVARYEAKQEISQNYKQQDEQASNAKQQAWQSEREAYATERAIKAIETIPEYKQLFIENQDILSSFPEHVGEAFMHLDAPEMAFFALAKEGRLEDLSGMSPLKMAAELGKAEIRGEALFKAKPITKAPTPIEGLKGTGTTNKSLETMGAKELLKWLDS